MIPIFSSLNMMQRALQVTQTSIQTTGHNISNANTDGYSRQRVNLATWLPYPSIGINAARGAGQIGTGVIDESITRIRDQFVDLQVRDNTNLNGYWSTISDAYSQMEDIINEPTDTGISATLDDFWQSLQDMASNSGTSGTGTTVLENAGKVADTFNYIAESLGKVQKNLNDQITENVKLVNNYATQINELNKNITKQEANGFLPNDLYDQRDALVDKLSQIVNVKVTAVPSSGNPSPLAEGKYTIEIMNQDNTASLGTLVDGTNLTTPPELSATSNVDDTVTPSKVTVDVTLGGTSIENTFSGKLQGLIDSYTTDYPQVLAGINNMAAALAENFNAAYKQTAGYNATDPGTFFIGDSTDPTVAGKVTAANIHVNENLTGDDVKPNGLNMPSGDNSGAQAMADVIAANKYDVDDTNGDGSHEKSDDGSTLKSYLEGLIGQIGVNAQKAEQFTGNSQTMLDAANNRRSSISGVSIDEELTNLIQFQHSYGAAARVVTTLDTMLDTLINKMG